jgi:hypothetical protein
MSFKEMPNPLRVTPVEGMVVPFSSVAVVGKVHEREAARLLVREALLHPIDLAVAES